MCRDFVAYVPMELLNELVIHNRVRGRTRSVYANACLGQPEFFRQLRHKRIHHRALCLVMTGIDEKDSSRRLMETVVLHIGSYKGICFLADCFVGQLRSAPATCCNAANPCCCTTRVPDCLCLQTVLHVSYELPDRHRPGEFTDDAHAVLWRDILEWIYIIGYLFVGVCTEQGPYNSRDPRLIDNHLKADFLCVFETPLLAHGRIGRHVPFERSRSLTPKRAQLIVPYFPCPCLAHCLSYPINIINRDKCDDFPP